MLTPEEENIVKEFKENAVASNYTIHPSQLEWMCERLLEINEECSKVWEELHTANQELARRAEFD